MLDMNLNVIPHQLYTRVWYRGSIPCFELPFPETFTMAVTDTWVSRPGETTGPLMSITGWSLCGVAAMFLVSRLCIRQHQGKLWLDDYVLGVSWVSSTDLGAASKQLMRYRYCFSFKLF
jgi:hypothetical protein